MMEVKFAEFKFPYPPTVNHCWGRSGKAYFLSAKYKTFLEDVALVVAGTKLIPSANYFLELTVTPPDRRKRDLDNVFKPILDALTRCCVWQDDSAVSFLKAERTEPSKIDAGVKVVVGIPSKAAVAELERQRRIQAAKDAAVLEIVKKLVRESTGINTLKVNLEKLFENEEEYAAKLLKARGQLDDDV